MDNEKFKIIDTAIKYVWMNKIKPDYENGFLLYEDSLKNALYFHLRNELSELINSTNVRIFTELHTWRLSSTDHQKIDLAIVELNNENQQLHLGDRIKCIYAIIEIKYKGFGAGSDKLLFSDVAKCIKYIENSKLGDPQVYIAFIQENTIYEDDDYSFLINYLQENNIQNTTNDRLTELLAYIPSGNCDSEIIKFTIKEHLPLIK